MVTDTNCQIIVTLLLSAIAGLAVVLLVRWVVHSESTLDLAFRFFVSYYVLKFFFDGFVEGFFGAIYFFFC